MQNVTEHYPHGGSPSTLTPLLDNDGADAPARAAMLVVEDDQAVRRLLQALLISADYVVHTAASGAEGLALCDAHRFDAVFLDITLPDMSGYDVLATLRAAGDTPAIVLLTADQDAVRRARAVGAAAALPKPFDIDDLLETTARLLSR